MATPILSPFVFALRLMDPPCCTLILLQQGGPRRELIATSLWEPTGWINRHLPGIDPRPMAGKKCGAAGSLSHTSTLFPSLIPSFLLSWESFSLCGIVAGVLECGVVCDSHFVVCFRFHFFDLGTTGGCLLAVPAWGG